MLRFLIKPSGAKNGDVITRWRRFTVQNVNEPMSVEAGTNRRPFVRTYRRPPLLQVRDKERHLRENISYEQLRTETRV